MNDLGAGRKGMSVSGSPIPLHLKIVRCVDFTWTSSCSVGVSSLPHFLQYNLNLRVWFLMLCLGREEEIVV